MRLGRGLEEGETVAPVSQSRRGYGLNGPRTVYSLSLCLQSDLFISPVNRSTRKVQIPYVTAPGRKFCLLSHPRTTASQS
jgi:hypothetical protein